MTTKARLRRDWRRFYLVWLQAKGRDGNDPEYAAECLTCGRWITETAGDRNGAWDVAASHERERHAHRYV